MEEYSLLNRICSPSDVKKLSLPELELLAAQIRRVLIDTVSQTGGHLSSNLGVVELTIALHRVFNSPEDKVIFDVGHQSYVHKLLTGRADRFSTLRTKDGLAGFTKMDESPHDAFGAGHSSTAVSAALGFSRAKALKGDSGYAIAIVGDGAFTGGMVYEALNNAVSGDKLIVILNENEMSISKNVGRFAEYLADIRNNEIYFKAKSGTHKILSRLGFIGRGLICLILWIKALIRRTLYKTNFFEQMGYDYLGPVDGNDIHKLSVVMARARECTRPVIIHIKTQKGKGFAEAEINPQIFHSVSSFDPDTGEIAFGGKKTFTSEMGTCLCEAAERDERICAITAAMADGTGLTEFAARFPRRFFDVGIAEQHAATFAAGLAADGMIPVFAVYSSFLQRSYDQIIHDIALQNLHCVLCVDRAGFVGGDGATHHGVFDAAFLSQAPNMTVYSPASFSQFRQALDAALEMSYPVAVRYAKSEEISGIERVFADTSRDNSFTGETSYDVLIITYGRIVREALRAKDTLEASGIKCAILLLNKIKPLNTGLIKDKSEPAKLIYILEEGIKTGGIGEQIGMSLSEDGGLNGKMLIVRAIEDRFVSHATVEEQIRECGLDAESVADEIIRAKC